MRVYLQTANLQYKYKKFIVSVGQCSMFVPRQLGSSKLGITVPHEANDVLMSNQFSKIWCFIPGKKQSNCYLWHLMSRIVMSDIDMTVWHHVPLVTAIQLWCSLTVASVPLHTWCNDGLQWCTVPRISMSIVCNQYSMSRYQLVSIHSMAWPCLGLLAALLTSMLLESFYVLSSLCFASSLELTILGWHYFGSDPVSSINDKSSYPIPLLQKNNASWA